MLLALDLSFGCNCPFIDHVNRWLEMLAVISFGICDYNKTSGCQMILWQHAKAVSCKGVLLLIAAHTTCSLIFQTDKIHVAPWLPGE